MFGVTAYVGPVVGLATFRELGPLITAIVLTGYAGASIAAELGTMKVNEELMALEVSALHPIGFLVVPRMIGLVTMALCLTVMGNAIAIVGGLFIGYMVLDVSGREFISLTAHYIGVKDFLTGLVKAGVFAVLIGLIACYEGLNVEGGAEGVGRVTTRAVVLSIVFVIVFDCFFTALFYFVLE
jgi:phospholipid/cholesterol/gamma-HCH transport system permease protein